MSYAKKLTDHFKSRLQAILTRQQYYSWGDYMITDVTYDEQKNLAVVYVMKGESDFYKDYCKREYANVYRKILTEILEKAPRLQIRTKE